jgi:hypothetical protein
MVRLSKAGLRSSTHQACYGFLLNLPVDGERSLEPRPPLSVRIPELALVNALSDVAYFNCFSFLVRVFVCAGDGAQGPVWAKRVLFP